MKILLITHRADPDGIAPVILSRYFFKGFDYMLMEPYEMDDFVIDAIEDHFFDDYEAIFIVDLSVSEATAMVIDRIPKLKKKLKIMDHHYGSLCLNEFSFASIIDVDEMGSKQSGTSQYYHFLLYQVNRFVSEEWLRKDGKAILQKRSVQEFVDCVRLLDTWQWQAVGNERANQLGQLFDIYGRDYFCEYYTEFLLEQPDFVLTAKEEYLLEIEEKRFLQYRKAKEEEIYEVVIQGHLAGVVFAEQYRSSLGNQLALIYQDRYDFIVIINFAHGISFRGIKDYNLSEIASVYGGKGHLKAAGAPVPSSLKQEILAQIFHISGEDIQVPVPCSFMKRLVQVGEES